MGSCSGELQRACPTPLDGHFIGEMPKIIGLAMAPMSRTE
jgi:hypothetical protein